MIETTTLEQEARKMGEEHGLNAASWYFNGNTSTETYAAVLRGMDDGDPEIMDSLPSSPLSGEWADSPTPQTVLSELAGTSAWDSVLPDWQAEVLLDEYETGFYEASQAEIERVARYHVA